MVSTILSMVLATITLLVAVTSGQPTVTLSHGGKLQGRSETFQDKPVDLFLGVRYARPPVGDLRLRKPEAQPGWEGVVEATTVGNACPQREEFEGGVPYFGEEDCLFLDITVPGRVHSGAKKPVMVWIHGGAYVSGVGSCYIGAPLAITGDIIVVTINYRLGILGFLSPTKDVGNFGLWDQRAALVWIKENIEQFGGDPELVTIFGDSAGAGSVAALTMSPRSEGLFKRAIQQSPYMMFGVSENVRHKVSVAIKEEANCAAEMDVLECMSTVSAEDTVNMQLSLPAYMTPVYDGDFFSMETGGHPINKHSHRFDLMVGMNGQEGGLYYEFELKPFAAQLNISTDDGVSMQLVKDYLKFKCLTQLTPFSPNLCVDYIISTYEIDQATDDKDRALRLTEFIGESVFNVDTANQLEQHSASDKAIYAYYFTELYKPDVPNLLWSMQDWMKKSADHSDITPFVFGAGHIANEAAKSEENVWKEMLATDRYGASFFQRFNQSSYSSLSEDMMRLWINFAVSGNPKKPLVISSAIPAWPEFTLESNEFMELNSEQCKLVPTPHKERLDSLRNNLFQAKKLQQDADVHVAKEGKEYTGSEKIGHHEL